MSQNSTFIDLLKKRRSIRRFLQRPVEPEKIDLLMEAALRTPSSRGLNPWEFIVITDSEMITSLSSAKPHGASFLKNAPLAVAVCANTTRSDVWIEDSSIAALVLHLAAADLGLASCWIQLRLRSHDDSQSASEFAAGILGLSEQMTVEAILAIGYAAEEKSPHKYESLPFDKVHYQRFGQSQKPQS